MIECVFSLDYEIYGDGRGALEELVYKPTERLKSIFAEARAPLVIFVEAAELEMIEAENTDSAIDLVRRQLQDLQRQGHELALHVHPQWYQGRYINKRWRLDYDEYNLCTLPRQRISQILARSIAYLRKVLEDSDFNPFSFRAGNWLLQPTPAVADALVDQGLRIDSSVYPGGLQHHLHLDYRKSRNNGYFWRFREDVNTPDPQGALLEVPTYTRMVPNWRMFSSKRIGLQRKSLAKGRSVSPALSRVRDILRPRLPMKLDFCRLTYDQLARLIDREIDLDRDDPSVFRPIVAIGHTKDLADLNTIRSLLSYLREKDIKIGDFRDVHRQAD